MLDRLIINCLPWQQENNSSIHVPQNFRSGKQKNGESSTLKRVNFDKLFPSRWGKEIIFQPRPHFDSVTVIGKRGRSKRFGRKCRLVFWSLVSEPCLSHLLIIFSLFFFLLLIRMMRFQVKAHLEFFWQFCFEANFSTPKGASAVKGCPMHHSCQSKLQVSKGFRCFLTHDVMN